MQLRDTMLKTTTLTMAFLLFATSAMAGTRSEADRIESAIKLIETSKVTFVRNGDEHSASAAGKFMRGKLRKAGDQVKTFDQFIDNLATKSTTSGLPYMVKLESGTTVPLAQWLREKDAVAAKPDAAAAKPDAATAKP